MITPDPIDAVVARLRAENAALLAALTNLVKAEDDGEAAMRGIGVAPETEDHPAIAAARRVIGKRPTIPCPPRFFREFSTAASWEFRHGRMTIAGAESLFRSPAELMRCLDVYEVDEGGEPLRFTPAEIDAIRADAFQQAEADES